MRKIIHQLLLQLRKFTLFRKAIIRLLAAMHGFSYQWIGFFSSYSGVHPKHEIIKYHDFFLDNINIGDDILDIGCGLGILAKKLSSVARTVYAIDIKMSNIEIAKSKYNQDNLFYVVGDATTYDFEKKFDVIVLSNVLEHIDNRVSFLKKIKKLSPKILIRVPLITRDWISVYKKNCGLEYRTDDSHYIEYTEEEFAEEIKESGLSIINYMVRFGELYAIIESKRSNDIS